MGHRTAGKSSAGNTILGREAFELKTAVQSEFKQRTVAGRKVTVVESPCWSESNVQNTAKMYQLEFMHSLFLCHPGPHALLLVLRVDTKYSEMNNRVLEEHLELLSQNVWNHTIVLFTHEDWLGQTPIERHIESEGGALQWLLEKCRNRYHVLNTKVKNDDMQVMQLFEKIEEMVAENKHCYYQLDQKILDAVKERRRAEERAKERELKAQRPREENRAKIERSEISSMGAEAVQRPHASVCVQDRSKLSSSFSYLSMKSDASILLPINFSSDHHSEHLTPDFVRYPACKEQQRDPAFCSCGHSCSWQCVPVPSASEDATHKPQHTASRAASPAPKCAEDLDYSNTTDDIKCGEVQPDL